MMNLAEATLNGELSPEPHIAFRSCPRDGEMRSLDVCCPGKRSQDVVYDQNLCTFHLWESTWAGDSHPDFI